MPVGHRLLTRASDESVPGSVATDERNRLVRGQPGWTGDEPDNDHSATTSGRRAGRRTKWPLATQDRRSGVIALAERHFTVSVLGSNELSVAVELVLPDVGGNRRGTAR